MSFILDALRKSESERQRDAAPSLARAPLAAVRQRVPLWTWILIGMLSIALIGLGVVFWRNADTETPAQVAVTAPADASASAPVQAEPVANRAEPPATTTELRSIRELATLDPDLPEYRLEVLAFNASDPARGSAWINGQRYVVGERIGRGPEIVEIRQDGVVLAHVGQRFLLSTR